MSNTHDVDVNSMGDTAEPKTHWKKLVDPRYIGVYSLPNNGGDLTVTIDFVRLETITMMGGKKEDHSIMHLKGQKPMILNATNSKSIHKLYGPYIEDWIGKKITLFQSTAKLASEIVECLRIRPKIPTETLPNISDDRFKSALVKIKANEYSSEKLKGKFSLTDTQKKILDDYDRERNINQGVVTQDLNDTNEVTE